jgi:hypothetical protein
VKNEADMVKIERNILFASHVNGQKNIAAWISPGCTFENNLIYDSWNAIVVRRGSWSNYRFLRVSYNTIFLARADSSTGVFSVTGLASGDQSTFIIANNVIWPDCATVDCNANNVYGYRWVGTQSSAMTNTNNYFQGKSFSESGAFTLLTNTSSTDYFNNPTGTFGTGADFVPLSGPIGLGGATPLSTPTNDYDGNARSGTMPSPGCYEQGASPHSAPTLNFKGAVGGGPGGHGSTLTASAVLAFSAAVCIVLVL